MSALETNERTNELTHTCLVPLLPRPLFLRPNPPPNHLPKLIWLGLILPLAMLPKVAFRLISNPGLSDEISARRQSS